MIIKSLNLENFKYHKSLNIGLEEKNIIIGENGVGKSSIFHSILFALFGRDSLSYIGASSIQSMIRYGSSSTKVELELQDNNNLYKIVRIINNTGDSKAVLYLNDHIIVSSPDLVNKKIKEILNINRIEKFADIVYIKQGDLGRYINLSGKIELTKKLENIFDIEYYSNILRVIEGLVRDLERQKEYNENQRAELYKDIETYRNLYGDRDINELILELDKYNNLKKIRDELYKDYLEVKTLENTINYDLISQEGYLKNKLLQLEEEEKNLNENIINLESERRSLKYERYSKELLDKSIEYINKRLEELKEYKDINKKDIEYNIRENKDLYNDIVKYINSLDVEDRYKKLEEKKKDIEEKILILKQSIKEDQEYLDILNKEITDCPVCKRPLEKDLHKQLVERYNIELDNNKRELSKLLKDKEDIDNLYNNIYNEYKNFVYLKERLKSKNIDIDNIENEKMKIDSKINQLNQELNKIEEYNILNDTINYIKSYEISKALENLKKDYNNIKDEISLVRKDIVNIENMKKNLEKIKNIYKKNNYSSLKDFEEKLNDIDNELRIYQNIKPELIKNYKNKLDSYNIILENNKKISKNINNLRSLYNIILKFIENRREKVALNLSNAFRYYFKKLYRYNDIVDVGIEIKEGKNKDERIFTIYIIKNIDNKELKKPVEDAGLSGGQTKLLDLSIRLAISSLLDIRTSFILLDEPTESLDENVRLSLAELLQLLDGYQILLCTHDDIFKDNIEGKIIEIKR
ncbi:DNA double-strand break repair Rad50 ATPase [Nanobdella aerobiophila]|uniref:DNA double-strand break repair Rad50 ATPase n=1 Tax=Nanobdella aerobiophila TaxID=2586965 RepID=A0A915WSP1_9ARCH|nr:SMC family ATPase [Nanobdella aerobiophila]BBL45417.1 DNA double-strand break repair Rad50 ATPase [Nanobdella aerobiophila]